MQSARTRRGSQCDLQGSLPKKAPENAFRGGFAPGTGDALQSRMLDLVLVLSTIGFFAFSCGYVRLCERL